ncbi:hypothetical protein HYT02_05600 [Candidatus Gottesmanbacteria bacterium]|nr:hypothetical protein [Candidatus Gottesmanbacteria bacterium]
MSERTTYVSSDVAGPLQNLRQVKQVYSEVFTSIDGVEYVAYRNARNIRDSISYLQDCGFKELSLHARMGGGGSGLVDRAQVALIDATIIPTSIAIKEFSEDFEILFHAPELMKTSSLNALKHKNPRFIWAENDHYALEGIAFAKRTVERLSLMGVRCGLMLDIAHALGVKVLKSGQLNTAWDELNAFVRQQLIQPYKKGGMKILHGIHLPIGRKKTDSLPVVDPSLVSDSMLTDIHDWIVEGDLRRVVIENQLGLPAALLPSDMKLRRQYVQVIFNRLQNSNIIRT